MSKNIDMPSQESSISTGGISSGAEAASLVEDTLSPAAILDSYIARQRKHSKTDTSGKKKSPGVWALLMIGLSVAIVLITVWMGIGLFMKLGILPWADFGYTWLDELIARIKG